MPGPKVTVDPRSLWSATEYSPGLVQVRSAVVLLVKTPSPQRFE